MRKLSKCYEYLIYVLPAVLFFSYYPFISFGGNETMNFEASLPLIWLIVFDFVSFVLIIKNKKYRLLLKKNWLWLMFPMFTTLSIIWSLNIIRGVLTAGVMWLIFFALFGIVTLVRDEMPKDDWQAKFMKVFYSSSVLVVLWCLIQSLLDVFGVGREYTLLCTGCTYKMFGFPHPNGFAIEPQFMGNLLLAPALVSAYSLVNRDRCKKYSGSCLKCCELGLAVLFASGIFLTFSRGAIYAYIIGMLFLIVFMIVKTKKWKSLILLAVMAGSFLFVLNVQGIFAQLSKTDDTYFDGISKVINHLSLGKIELRSLKDKPSQPAEEKVDGERENAVFDGYVEESTDTRVRLTNAAFRIWGKNLRTALFGVGIGGAGQALYNNGLSSAPKEIVQNEYMSLLLETGVVGFVLFVVIIILLVVWVIKSQVSGIILALIVSYGITLFFFSGLPNAIHIFILPVMLVFALQPQKNASV